MTVWLTHIVVVDVGDRFGHHNWQCIGHGVAGAHKQVVPHLRVVKRCLHERRHKKDTDLGKDIQNRPLRKAGSADGVNGDGGRGNSGGAGGSDFRVDCCTLPYECLQIRWSTADKLQRCI
jgi:hypothetical protein